MIDNILNWAKDRKIIPNSNAKAQMLKLVEEVGELSSAVAKNKLDEAKDAIGDITVVLVILANLMGLKYEDCVESAYNEIKDRKGFMNENGVFVKVPNND